MTGPTKTDSRHDRHASERSTGPPPSSRPRRRLTVAITVAPVDPRPLDITLGGQIVEGSHQQRNTPVDPRPLDITLVMLGAGAGAAVVGHNMVADHGFTAWFTTNHVDFAGLA